MRRAAVLAALAVAAALALGPGTAALAGAACGPVETTPDEGHQHLLGEAPPPAGYRTVPPASGWHYRERGRVRLGVQPADAPLSEAEQVSVLAVGGVVVSYHDLAPADVAVLAETVAGAAPRPVTLTRYDALEPGEVALTAWRRLQRCDGAVPGAVEAFVASHAAAEPDFAMTAGDEPADAPMGGLADAPVGGPGGEAHGHAAAAGGGAQPERVPGAVLMVAAGGAVTMLAAAGWRALARGGAVGRPPGRVASSGREDSSG